VRLCLPTKPGMSLTASYSYRLPGRPTRPATRSLRLCRPPRASGRERGRQKTEAKTACRVGVIHHPSPVPAQARRHTPSLARPPISTATSVSPPSPRLTSRRRRSRVRPGKANSRARTTARSRSADVQVRPGRRAAERRAGTESGRRRWRQRAARAGRRRRGEVDGGAVEDGGRAGAGAAATPGRRVALLPPRPRRHGVQPARRQPGLPPVPRVQVSATSAQFSIHYSTPRIANFCHGLC
jgi:hypothetical protein